MMNEKIISDCYQEKWQESKEYGIVFIVTGVTLILPLKNNK